ncbi:hypothetical protein ILUMI_23928 [Ignelater luminosus]|uniref:Uncharacterized protein n=1 Tax=Ignelater luminosus TaxID=2038154 RepID=A0A8K0C776_IGNLU|nr:hypothetical protein ILUMI_23928 [Ignelater luminosus]
MMEENIENLTKEKLSNDWNQKKPKKVCKQEHKTRSETEPESLRRVNKTIRKPRSKQEALLKEDSTQWMEKLSLFSIGHIHRMEEDRLLRQVYEARPTGKNKIERPRNRWQTTVRKSAAEKSIQWEMIHNLTNDRKNWKMKASYEALLNILLRAILTKRDLLNFPERIFNMNEKGCRSHLRKDPRVLSQRGAKQVGKEHEESVTVVGGGNAVGSMIPPMKYKRIQPGEESACRVNH